MDIQLDSDFSMLGANTHASLPRVELVKMRQQTEIRTPHDDWTGRNNAAQRRKLQNRLHQRSYRRRRRPKPECFEPKSDDSLPLIVPSPKLQLSGKFRGLIAAVERTAIRDESERLENSGRSQYSFPGTRQGLAELGSQHICQAQLAEILIKFEQSARRDHILGSPRVDQLLTLIQFNVFRALLSNTSILGRNLEWLECSDPISPWNCFPADTDPAYPEALRPTYVQRTIQHHPWLDLWPIPQMRDNLLLAGDLYDEDQLCNDLVEFHDVTNEQTGLIVWGEPWDPAGWEVSETFLKNWGWAVIGCVELLDSTNYWRRRRGEEPLTYEVFGQLQAPIQLS